MKIKWADFRDSPMKYLEGVKEVKVERGDGSYFRVRHYSPYMEDGGHKIQGPRKYPNAKVKKDHRCNICGKTERVLWVVPFDASYSPGWYCYKCRRARDIMDIKRAKKYNKIV